MKTLRSNIRQFLNIRVITEKKMQSKMKKLLIGLSIGAAGLLPMTSFAVTECGGLIAHTFAGDGGVYVFLTTGASGYIPSSDMNMKYVFASATAAFMSNRQVTIRFQASGLTCNNTTSMQPVVGIWLH